MTDIQKRAEHARKVLKKAVAQALDKKGRLGQYAVICKDGKVVRVPPHELLNEKRSRE